MQNWSRFKEKYATETRWYIAKVKCNKDESIVIGDGQFWYKRTGLREKDTQIMELNMRNLESLHEAIGYVPESDTGQLEAMVSDLQTRLQDMELANTDLSDALAGSETRMGELECTVSDLQQAHEDDRSTISRLQSEVDDVNQTISHLQSEMRRRDSVDVKGIIGSMLEYVTALENMMLDCKEEIPFRDMAEARRQKLMMDLSSQGLSVSAPSRGQEVDDGRVDISTLDTDDPTAEGTVARVNRYGFSFRDDVFPGEAPSVTVFKKG